MPAGIKYADGAAHEKVRASHRVMLPREHGAWAMLLTPYLIGTAVAGFSVRALPGLAGVLLLFFSRPPLALLLKRKTREGSCGSDSAMLWINFVVPSTLAAGLFGWMIFVYRLWWLMAIGLAGVVLFSLHFLMIWRRKERSVTSELIGIAMLTLTAPLSAYLAQAQATSQSAWQAALLWFLCGGYFGVSVFYVKMKLSAAAPARQPGQWGGKLWIARGSVIYSSILVALISALVVAGRAPRMAPAAYVPMLLYLGWNVARPKAELRIKKEGVALTVLSACFAGLMILAYRLSS
ncbi:MAG: YwiC-like family protein [Thermoleophilia bacterium]